MNDITLSSEAVRDLLEAAPMSDVYFRGEYLAASEVIGDGKGTSLALGEGPMRALCNVLVRRSARVLDAFTPYGYGGLLWLSHPHSSPDASRYIFDRLRDWCRAEGLVGCLLRLHPLLAGEFCLEGLDGVDCRVRERGVTLAVKLADWNRRHDRPGGMKRGRISDLSFARRHVKIEVLRGAGQIIRSIEIFKEIYDETMTRVHAAAFYRFPLAYYEALISGLDTRLMLVLARTEERYVGAALFFVDHPYAHYHLSGTTIEGLRLKATTLMVHEAAVIARREECEWLHLGGGLKPNDSLHRFKASFGAQAFPSRYVTVIADREKYDSLLRENDPVWPYRSPLWQA